MLQQNFDYEFDQVASAAWTQSQPPGADVDHWMVRVSEPKPPTATFRIYDGSRLADPLPYLQLNR
jgi:hypothetical protein